MAINDSNWFKKLFIDEAAKALQVVRGEGSSDDDTQTYITIRDKLIELGLATSTTNLDELADTIEGIDNVGAVSVSVQEGDTYIIPAGYHNGRGTVSVAASAADTAVIGNSKLGEMVLGNG